MYLLLRLFEKEKRRTINTQDIIAINMKVKSIFKEILIGVLILGCLYGFYLLLRKKCWKKFKSKYSLSIKDA